jgi:hypothetical protein
MNGSFTNAYDILETNPPLKNITCIHRRGLFNDLKWTRKHSFAFLSNYFDGLQFANNRKWNELGLFESFELRLGSAQIVYKNQLNEIYSNRNEELQNYDTFYSKVVNKPDFINTCKIYTLQAQRFNGLQLDCLAAVEYLFNISERPLINEIRGLQCIFNKTCLALQSVINLLHHITEYSIEQRLTHTFAKCIGLMPC